MNPAHRTSAAAGPTAPAGGVIIGGDFQGLGIARSLGRQGIPVCIIDDEWSIGRFSRYATHSVRVKNLRDEGATISSVMEVGARLNLQGWVLYPTRDETVAAFSKHRDLLARQFRVATPEWETARWAWDKRNTYQKAAELGIATPRTWYPTSVTDLDQIDSSFPLVIKPAIKEHFMSQTKVKAWRADSRADLVEKFNQALALIPVGEIMIQDLIPGGSEHLYGVCVFFKGETALGSMVTQYKRQHPPQFGRSCTLVESAAVPQIEELAQRFLRETGYYGLAEIEFKQDPRDGQFKLLDVNARTWGYHALGAAAGVDFVHMLHRDQLGLEITPARARPGVSWIRLATDFPVGLLGVLKGQWGVRDYIKSITCYDIESVYSSDDRMPSFAEAAAVPYFFFKKGY